MSMLSWAWVNKMISKWASKITALLIRKGAINEAKAEIYTYGYECGIATALQLLLLGIMGIVLDCLMPLLVFTVFFSNTKKRIGGWHAKNHTTCFVMSTFFSVVPVKVCGLLPKYICLLFLAVSTIIILIFAPIPHENNPKTLHELAQGRKMVVKTLCLFITLTLLIYVTGYRILAVQGACGMMSASVTLLPESLRRKGVKMWMQKQKSIKDINC